jgi:pyruvate/2-oxoglutarate dehydrogenase complex dihydrolipoamide dehydrogenase (E3) component
MKYDFDLICIGLGPAGMAVSAMAAEMGLKVCAVEKNKVGGECMNVGCIPSKSILEIARMKKSVSKLKDMGLTDSDEPVLSEPFTKISSYLNYISSKKTMKMFDKVELILEKGSASFIDSHTVLAGDRKISAQKIFIATGTEPLIPNIDGIKDVEVLDNTNIFTLPEVPKSMTIIGGGSIGSEMAQAFSRLGTKCIIVQMDDHLIPIGNKAAGDLLEAVFAKEGIDVHNSQKINKVYNEGGEIVLTTEQGLSVKSEKLLVGCGRKVFLDDMKLENAGVKYTKKGITVDSKQRTNVKHIYAVGDCTGGIMLSHAAMHQGMIAIMSAVSPFSLFNFKKYVIPWTVFTEPQVSYVGMTENELKRKKIKYETVVANYADYGAAIAENASDGYVKVFASKFGKVYGVSIVGKGSGEMINEWALIVQKKIKLQSVLFLAHSFPTMGFLSKRISEIWVMDKMKSSSLRKMLIFMFRKF